MAVSIIVRNNIRAARRRASRKQKSILAPAGSGEITLRDLPITLLGGTRYDSYRGSSDGYKDVDADKWSSRRGMTINPANWLMLFGSYAQAFRAPTMGEMYNDSKHFSIGRFYTNYWVPNPNLRPETNETQEYGFWAAF
ncbi:hemin TonB-dependent receptor [Escherichia coli]|uniref:Hemin TonB-dependent receptor n=1 Tax=Escherichia coli TaxID=562 RepID=A0A3S4K5Q2_ECOLX|nr:hemin TonB-dependent receptor [Escherichia coli]